MESANMLMAFRVEMAPSVPKRFPFNPSRFFMIVWGYARF
jgi:hypothetical protein